MKFRAEVEPTEPMRGLEVPEEVVEALGEGKRPPVTITVNGYSWKSRVAIMRGRYLLGLSTANRRAAGVSTGDVVEVDVVLDAEPRVVVEPPDLTDALDAVPAARAAYDRLSYSHRREHVRRHRDRQEARDPGPEDRGSGGEAVGRRGDGCRNDPPGAVDGNLRSPPCSPVSPTIGVRLGTYRPSAGQPAASNTAIGSR